MSDTVQLMIVAPCLEESAGPLAAALARATVSCVLIVPPDWQAGAIVAGDDPSAALATDACRALVTLAQAHDTAVLIANDAGLAADTGADGCHLDAGLALEERYGKARALLGGDAIVGVMPGALRHTAMTLAENGADYIGYAVSGAHAAGGLDLVGWWAEIFESPVVAFTDGDIDHCRHAIEAGPPDFIATPLQIGGALDHLDRLGQLIVDCGQLPVAAKDAK